MNETQKLSLRRFLMITFLFGSILLGLFLVCGSVYVAVEFFQTYKEHGVFLYRLIPIVSVGLAFGFLIPWFVVSLSRIALNSIRKEQEILMKKGIEGLTEFRDSNEAVYPKKLGLNKNKNPT